MSDFDKDFDSGLSDDPTEQQPVDVPPQIDPVQDTPFDQEAFRKSLFDELPQHIRASTDSEAKRMWGTIGQLQGEFKKMQSGAYADISADDLNDVREVYPELADALEKTFRKVLSKKRPDADEHANSINQRLGEIEKTVQESYIESRYKDWREVIGLPNEHGEIPRTAFREWLATKPADYQEKMRTTNSGRDIVSALSEFEKYSAEKSKKEDLSRKRNAGLRSAVTPKPVATRPAEKTAEDYFNEGLRG